MTSTVQEMHELESTSAILPGWSSLYGGSSKIIAYITRLFVGSGLRKSSLVRDSTERIVIPALLDCWRLE